MILAVMNAILCNCVFRRLKNSGHQGSLNHDLAIPVGRSNQLSYEATDAGNSFDRLIEPTNREVLRVF